MWFLRDSILMDTVLEDPVWAKRGQLQNRKQNVTGPDLRCFETTANINFAKVLRSKLRKNTAKLHQGVIFPKLASSMAVAEPSCVRSSCHIRLLTYLVLSNFMVGVASFQFMNFLQNWRQRCPMIFANETEQLQALLNENLAQTQEKLATQLGVDRITISRRLYEMRKIMKLEIGYYKSRRVFHLDGKTEYSRQEDSFLSGVWWDAKSVLYYELLEPGQTINVQRYSD
ncbi:PREDICTED: uncharacterized protein LOC106747961 [Dinoponera quadriceps]|uniref:Uncharacterized protein LOC106747961 n=1 Tax=Dinoponera quadriceps TaxID=609295 RepID=A0A6P3XSL4_DINQU|nr:PREDICTED: uncharacterized protein LOC106747961 [Dinoponera quadriceps]